MKVGNILRGSIAGKCKVLQPKPAGRSAGPRGRRVAGGARASRGGKQAALIHGSLLGHGKDLGFFMCREVLGVFGSGERNGRAGG